MFQCAVVVAAFFEYLPKITINEKGARTVWVRCDCKSKERATVMLLGDSDGRKHQPFVIFKTHRSNIKGSHEENLQGRHGFGKTVWREIEPLQNELQIHGNAKGTSSILLLFLLYAQEYLLIFRIFLRARLVERIFVGRVSSLPFC